MVCMQDTLKNGSINITSVPLQVVPADATNKITQQLRSLVLFFYTFRINNHNVINIKIHQLEIDISLPSSLSFKGEKNRGKELAGLDNKVDLLYRERDWLFRGGTKATIPLALSVIEKGPINNSHSNLWYYSFTFTLEVFFVNPFLFNFQRLIGSSVEENLVKQLDRESGATKSKIRVHL